MARLRAALEREFQSTLPSRGATAKGQLCKRWGGISIHAPLAGSDASLRSGLWERRHFNPRSPRGERRISVRLQKKPPIFQSTLPSRGATRRDALVAVPRQISIHAPLAGSDGPRPNQYQLVFLFQSTLPSRGATAPNQRVHGWLALFQSTLPSRGATPAGRCWRMCARFQSTLPSRGATSPVALEVHHVAGFQSTLPSRGATFV